MAAVFPNAEQFDAMNVNLATFHGAMGTQNAILSRIAGKLGAFENPPTWAALQALVRAGLIDTVARVGDQVEASMNPVVTAEVSGSGVTAVTVDKDVFTAAVGIDSISMSSLMTAQHGTIAAPLWSWPITASPSPGRPASGDAVVVHITATVVDFDIQGIDEDAPVGAGMTHSVSLLMHNCLYNMAFDPAPVSLLRRRCRMAGRSSRGHLQYHSGSRRI